MTIDIRIPYDPDKNIALAYNTAVQSSSADWLLFLDWDVFLLLPNFYSVLLSVIDKVPANCGWISARTNRLGPRTVIHQLCADAPQSDDINEHSLFANQMYDRHEDDIYDITALAKKVPLSGCFILTPRKVAEKIKFRGELLGCDNHYNNDLINNGYTIYLMPGFYIYHNRKRQWMK